MINETEARKLLEERMIERDITEPRSCLEVAIALGLVSIESQMAEQQGAKEGDTL